MNILSTMNTKELAGHLLLNTHPGNDPATEEYINRLRRDTVDKPVIYVGTGTCGMVAGAKGTLKAIRQYLSEKSIDAEIIEVGCIGMCIHEPMVDVQLPGKRRIAFSCITENKVEPLLDEILNYEVPADNLLGQYSHPNHEAWDGVRLLGEMPYFRLQNRLVLRNCGIINPYSIEEYIARGGYRSLVRALRNYAPDKVCEIIEESGLRGRGGGGFPTGRKWKTALNTQDDERFLICNGDESDPGAFMDRAIFEGDPHKLIEGTAIAAYAVNAKKAFIYVRAEYSIAVDRLRQAIQQANDAGLLGYNILNSGYNLQIQIREGAGAFVCGEETALISSIEGKRGTPRPKPPFPSIRGLFGKPTVVNNVETLANVPAIIENGPSWFNSMGTSTSKGTKVFALAGRIAITGLAEVTMGTSLKDLIYIIAGGVRDGKRLKAIQLGGPSGSCLPEKSLDVLIDYEALLEAGTIMGSGGLVVMDEDTCMVDIAKFFTDFLQRESCGKCIPCREGSRRMHEIMENITRRPVNESGHETLERFKGVMQLENLAEVIKDTSLCGLGQTAPNPLLSALKYFREEFEEHIFDRKCRAGVCKDLKVYYIDVDKCTGCTACAKKCPTTAIIGSPRIPHFIIEDKCIGCGICFDVCKFVAVFVK
ncbi:NADH-ubiquinone oxidoreductase-F iron-sulfur binding region domain-containing protein [Lentimicrobium sp.]|jgi:NADH:ubiquinone oxidoreductase subunit F (NADH-binding)/Pyruvate/2-oxoacid:ferredoxin oxidoreductase delta subunit|uniref:NADH-ubiquinone oxidoreductase-F iron-sulfur binding region domain-containing protein n=1 Tax=Lentimicrobium sp. TaxID=2034841 RepID=UPI0025D3A00E|nr:NADH-ubiquinone oxidoreductase-F iron-sulfur binding region domain-containing protein [Lentimicrobium sp.]MCO5257195.1 4Fe-4S binding protein [Lentimicrobium sp.]MCO5263545.1 4Fe-4S binding protein [Lentimicrobium sp.]HOP12849.1 NADH-ubiquinone oxidoreductase-F iron-sulfur binding region domain-containing protein [Lentimicrobium sp.]HPF64846.1 NADH-ubiquinone oxidoreductase-F iron-sulfur binding region domain-containing protein [Lentimicrobium sp.]HPR26131.1 NADH-ubiquinone oxidoreductase-F